MLLETYALLGVTSFFEKWKQAFGQASKIEKEQNQLINFQLASERKFLTVVATQRKSCLRFDSILKRMIYRRCFVGSEKLKKSRIITAKCVNFSTCDFEFIDAFVLAQKYEISFGHTNINQRRERNGS